MSPKTNKRILCPIDFSECSRRALARATELANESNATLFVVHVDLTGSSIPPNHRGYVVELDNHKKLLDETANVEVADKQTHYLRGHAVDELQRFIALRDIDVIVLGTHGRTGFAKLMMGSVAEQLSKCTSCEVVLISPVESEVAEPA